MAINRIRILITVLFLMGLIPLRAQNSVQRLTWTGDEYAMRYEVIIEKEEEGTYNRALREFTEDFFIEVSLPFGKYRFQVIPHDFFNRPIPVTEWMDFEILSVNTDSGDETNHAEIPLTAPEPEIIIEYKNLFDIYLSAAWIPLLPIYKESREKKQLGENTVISPFGAALRFGIIPAKQRFFNPGMELAASWRIYTADSVGNVQSLLFDCNMIQRFRFPDGRNAINVRLGAGISLVFNDDSRWVAGQQYSPYANIGASLFSPIQKNFFLETGMEYSQLFTRDFFCFIRWWIGLGYQF